MPFEYPTSVVLKLWSADPLGVRGLILGGPRARSQLKIKVGIFSPYTTLQSYTVIHGKEQKFNVFSTFSPLPCSNGGGRTASLLLEIMSYRPIAVRYSVELLSLRSLHDSTVLSIINRHFFAIQLSVSAAVLNKLVSR